MDDSSNTFDNPRTDSTEAIVDFWNRIASQHGEFTKKCLRDNGWVERKLNGIFPGNKFLDVADIGTGAGFVAITLASLGHRVVATDISEKMLEIASRNAVEYNVDITFVKDDIQDTKLNEQGFDLVILRDVLYGLKDVPAVFENVIKLIRPGGYMLIVDGNYFLHLHQEPYDRRHQYFMTKDGGHEYANMMDFNTADYEELEKLVGDFEVNKVCRPYHDLSMITQAGMNNLMISTDDQDDFNILTEKGWTKVPFRYTLAAQKPFDDKVNDFNTSTYSPPLSLAEDGISLQIRGVFESLSNPDRV